MSRMTKYLHQSCMFEAAQRDRKGDVVLDDYGDVQYAPPRSLRCRRERAVQDIQTSTGAILRSVTCYYLDNAQELYVNDKLDGHVVLELEEYTNALGIVEGYECYV